MGTLVNSFLQHMHGVSGIHALLLLAAGMLLESTLVPIPSELVLPVAGIWAAQGKFGSGDEGLCEAIALAMLGSLLGSGISYAIGYYGGKPFVRRYGRYFFVHSSHLDAAEKWLSRHGTWSVAVGRVLFGVRHVQSIVAGTLKMSWPRFMAATAAGCLVWNGAGVFLGYRFGRQIEGALRSASLVMLGVIAAVVAVGVALSVAREKRSHQSAESKRPTRA